jgi:DNA-directed RNA polymerase specialized sigma54-like protein
MSQVISSLDATGLYHDEVSEIYKALGRQTIKASEIEIAVTEEYLKSLQPSSVDANSLQHIKNILKKENLTSEDIRDFIWNNPKD